jgi:hypothetical protein
MKAGYLIFLTVFATWLKNVESSQMKGIEFTSKSSDSIHLLFDYEVNYSKGFTTCLRVMFTYINLNIIFNSQNVVSLTVDVYLHGRIVVNVGGINHHFQWPSDLPDLQPFVWYVFCTSFDAERNLVRLAVDDTLIFRTSKIQNDQAVVGNSTLLRENSVSPFIGTITDVNVWNRSLSDVEIKDFVFCNIDPNSKKAFQWSNSNLTQIGKYNQIVAISLEDICVHPSPPKIRWFKTRMNYESAMFVTQYLNGEMSLPSNKVSLQSMFTNTDLRILCGTSFWVPIVRAKANSSLWVNGYNMSTEVKYLPWSTGQPNGYPSQNCVGAEKEDFGYTDIECTSKMCFNIFIAKSQIFHLRGSCVAGDNYDSKYAYNFNAGKSNEFIIQGFSGKSLMAKYKNDWNLMIYNKTLDNFVLVASLWNMEKFPFGTQNWTFSNGYENVFGRYCLIKLTKVRLFKSS